MINLIFELDFELDLGLDFRVVFRVGFSSWIPSWIFDLDIWPGLLPVSSIPVCLRLVSLLFGCGLFHFCLLAVSFHWLVRETLLSYVYLCLQNIYFKFCFFLGQYSKILLEIQLENPTRNPTRDPTRNPNSEISLSRQTDVFI